MAMLDPIISSLGWFGFTDKRAFHAFLQHEPFGRVSDKLVDPTLQLKIADYLPDTRLVSVEYLCDFVDCHAVVLFQVQDL